MSTRSPGWWLQATAVGHAGVGAALYRDGLRDIGRAGFLRAVPDHGERATAFWFVAAAPALWSCGRLLRAAEAAGDAEAQRAAGAVLVGTGVVGAAAMPAGGFWALIAVGVAARRRARRRGAAVHPSFDVA